TGTAITWVDQNNPVIQSSNDVGKVKVDDTDKTMSTNGEIGTNGTSKVSINRPDLWEVGKEYDFGSNLYGYRQTGTTPSLDGTITLVTDTSSFIAFGGYITNITPDDCPVGYTVNSNNYSRAFRHPADKNFNIYIVGPQMNSRPYDIWVTYKK
ncbi:MAG: hypothetical protein LBK50_00660, partial [Candidatus Nomurabacteria bacterium]|nr:hypothetical protein [Candidatus Nomurabacteria bacterium]